MTPINNPTRRRRLAGIVARQEREQQDHATGERVHYEPLPPGTDPLGGLSPAQFAREAARDARERGLTALAQQWEDEAFRLAPPAAAPWHETDREVMPDGTAPIRLSFAVRVF